MMAGEESWLKDRFELLERLQRTIDRCKADPGLAESSVLQEAERRAQEVYNLLHAKADQHTWARGEPTMHFWPPPLDTFEAAERAVLALAKRAPTTPPAPSAVRRTRGRSEGSVSQEVRIPRAVVLEEAHRRTRPPPPPATKTDRSRDAKALPKEPSWASEPSLDGDLLRSRDTNPWKLVAIVLGALLIGVLLGGIVWGRPSGEKRSPPARGTATHTAALATAAPADRADVRPRVESIALSPSPASATTITTAGATTTAAATTTATATATRTATPAPKLSSPTGSTAAAAASPVGAEPRTVEPAVRTKRAPAPGREPPLPRKKGAKPASKGSGATSEDCRKSSNPLCGIPL